MMLRLKLAFRNILRHRGRTTVNIIMIAGAIVAQVIFAGFAHYIVTRTGEIMIDHQFGHVQIATQDYWDSKPGKRKNNMIPDGAGVSRELAKDRDVVTASGRLAFFGLLSTGEITVSAKGMGFDPRIELDFAKNLALVEGKTFTPDSKNDVVIGAPLAKKAGVKVGETVTVLGYTLDGVVNALDLHVTGLFSTGNEEIDSSFFIMPLEAAQNLIDTDRVDLISIRLKETGMTDRAAARLQTVASGINSTYAARTWYDLAVFYVKVEGFFRTQNTLIQTILLMLIFLGIFNTVGMSIYERTGEIGTVRSFGEKPRSVVDQFVLEGFMFGLIGSVIGVVLACLLSLALNSVELMVDLPGTSRQISLVIVLLPMAYLQAVLVVVSATVAASLIPSIRAVKMPIVEALRKNI